MGGVLDGAEIKSALAELGRAAGGLQAVLIWSTNTYPLRHNGDTRLKTVSRRRFNLKTIDWQNKESARAGIRRLVKRLLKKHKYPPEGMDDAVQTVMSRCEMWTDTASNPMSDTAVLNMRNRDTLPIFAKQGSWKALVSALENDAILDIYRE